MNSTLFRTKIVPALLTGTGRQPIVDVPGPDAELRALSLAGQALRFGHPASPASFAVEPHIADDRAILPDALRRPLQRVLGGRLGTEHAGLALACAFDRLRLRPHPFDLPRLESFVRSHAERLGTTAQYWVRPAEDAAAPSGRYFDDELLSDANWLHATLARKAAYLETRRQASPADGLALLEAAWPQFEADTRLRLLRALEPALHPGDLAFLESLGKDRSPKVRTLGQRLLARLGSGGGNPALTELLGRLKKTQTGLLRKRPALALELPATVKDHAAPMWLREAFAEVGFHELARALQLTEEQIVEAAGKDERLLVGLALVAIADRRLDLLERLVRDHLPQAWELLEQTGLRDLTHMSPAERLRWAAILAQPYGRSLPTAYLQWSWMHRMLQQQAPPPLLDAALAPGWLESLPDLERQGPAWLELLAALCPPERRGLLRSRLGMFDSALTATAVPLTDILEAMETLRPHA